MQCKREQLFTFENLQPLNVWYLVFAQKITLTTNSSTLFMINRLID